MATWEDQCRRYLTARLFGSTWSLLCLTYRTFQSAVLLATMFGWLVLGKCKYQVAVSVWQDTSIFVTTTSPTYYAIVHLGHQEKLVAVLVNLFDNLLTTIEVQSNQSILKYFDQRLSFGSFVRASGTYWSLRPWKITQKWFVKYYLRQR